MVPFLRSIAGFLIQQATRLVPDRRGYMSVYAAAALIPLIGFAGIATDTARSYMVKSRLSAALDSAGLAGGWSFFLATRDQDIQMFFDGNFPDGFMGATVTGPHVVVDEANEKLTLTATASVPTVFMGLFGKDQVNIYTEAEITREMQALDVVLAFDMSGSMRTSLGNGTRISAARSAANDLLDILYGNHTSKDLLNVGVVPWNAKVNVMLDGVAYDPELTTSTPVPAFTNPVTSEVQDMLYFVNNSPVPLLEEPPEDWPGCVYTRFVDDDTDTSDADILEPITTTSDGTEWVGWEPIGPEGEPVDNNGGDIEILQSNSTSNRSSSITAAWDTTPREGNLLLAAATRRAGGNNFSTPAGWTSILNFNADDGGTSRRIRVFAKQAGSSETGVTLDASNTVQQGLTILEVTNMRWSGLVDNIRTTDNTELTDNEVDFRAVDSNNRGSLVLAVAGLADNDFSNFSWTNSFSQVADVESVGGDGEDLTHSVGARVISGTSNYATDFHTGSGSSEESWGALIALEGSDVCSGSVSGGECTRCLGHGITPMSNTKSVAVDAIAALQNPDGNTNIVQGLGWAWRVLSPPTPFDEGLEDPPYRRQQAVVLLTDGEHFGGNGDGYKGVLGTGSAARPALDERLRKLSLELKSQGVILYVIQFAFDGTELQTLLKEVASGPDSPFYHYAPDAASLKQVFREVANHLSQLRLSK